MILSKNIFVDTVNTCESLRAALVKRKILTQYIQVFKPRFHIDLLKDA